MHKIGDLVENPPKPEWGPGKILEINDSQVTVYFRDVNGRAIRTIDTNYVKLIPASIQSDPFLDNLPPYSTDAREKFNKRLTLADGLDKFRHYFPKLFDDPNYLEEHGRERWYKWKVHEEFREKLGNGKGRKLVDSGNIDALTHLLLQIEGHLNLLSPYEKMALKEGLADERAAMLFCQALFDVIESQKVTDETYNALISAVNGLPHEEGRARVATWPVLTLFPFIARPDCHMFLKPEVTKQCADRMLFDLNYKTDLNLATYKQLLRLSDALFDLLKPLGARDYIDIQSFIWVIGAYK